MTLILKFPFPSEPVSTVLELGISRGARFLHFDIQRGVPTIWLAARALGMKEARRFEVRATGDRFDTDATYLASAMSADGSLVLHLFEEPIV
jgi:hypothetical protein